MAAESTQISAFQGLEAGPRRPLHTDRRPIDQPRELKNMLVDDLGHLWMPKAPDRRDGTLDTASGERISAVWWTVVVGKLAQQGSTIYASARTVGNVPDDSLGEEWNWIEIITDVGSNKPVWVTSFGYSDPDMTDRTYVGNDKGTWRIEYTGSETWSVTDLTTTLDGFHGWASFQHLGRRWVARDSQLVYYSAINDPETFTADDYLNVGGDSMGKDASTFPGEVTGFFLWETNLGIMCAGSMWMLSGASVPTFHLRKMPHDVGSQGRTDLHYHHIPGGGFLFLGGERDGSMGVYLFSGARPQKVSKGIEHFFSTWQLEYDDVPDTQTAYVKVRDEIGEHANATRYRGYYVLSFGPADADRSVYVWHIGRQAWSTFTGWGGPSITTVHDYYHPQRLLIGDSSSGEIHSSTEPMPRYPGENAQFTLGWSDEGQTSGLVRFMGLKLRGWRSGSGTPTVTVTATTDLGGSTTSGPTDLPADVFEAFVVPINIRGAAIEIDVTITPAQDDDQVLIEGMELISSRKGEKLSRP